MVVFHIRSFRKKAALWALGLAVLLLGLILLLSGCLRGGEDEINLHSGVLDTNESRLAYLLNCGWEVKPEPVESLHLVLPDPLTAEYTDYEKLQQQQGLSLADGCGKQVLRCTYDVTNYPNLPDGVQVNLYLCEGTVIAGDVMSMGENGFQAGLAYPAQPS